jgi:hypothetical protein
MAEHLGEAIAAFAKSHGGAVQREDHENEGHGPWPRSEIADLWVEDWCMGLKSAVEVQRDAAAVWQGGLRHPEVERLGKMGTSGTWQGNCNRDMENFYMPEVLLPKPYYVTIPVLNHTWEGSTVVWVDYPILLPHLVFGCMAKNFPQVFEAFHGGSKLSEFWDEHDASDPRLFQHPMLNKHLWRQRAIAVKVFGDAGVWTEDDSMYVFAVAPLLPGDSIWERIIAMALIPASLMCKRKLHGWSTDEEIWKPLVWSLNLLFRNVHTALAHTGDPWSFHCEEPVQHGPILPDGFFVPVLSLCADAEYQCNHWGLPHWQCIAF